MNDLLITKRTENSADSDLPEFLMQTQHTAGDLELGAKNNIQMNSLYTEINFRKQRNKIFDPKLFGEPAWDILLDLFSDYLENDLSSVSSVCIAGQCPQSTALRYLDKLKLSGLIKRKRDYIDCRRIYVSLTSDGIHKMGHWFERTNDR